MCEIDISLVNKSEYHDLSIMVGELLDEIMQQLNQQVFNYDPIETEKKAKSLIEKDKYWVFLAKQKVSGDPVGFVSIYESYALYSECEYGTIPELYVRPRFRSKNIGQLLLQKTRQFACEKGWKRVEVTTPPIPEFERTLSFYQKNGFEITGGRKLKMDIANG